MKFGKTAREPGRDVHQELEDLDSELRRNARARERLRSYSYQCL